MLSFDRLLLTQSSRLFSRSIEPHMILRRVIQHVQSQNWIAILIDLVIVVVGVYIGIQAQAWHTARDNQTIERQYLLSLHEQLSNMIEENEDLVVAARDRLAALSEVSADFEVTGERSPLGLRHCRAISISHIYVGRIFIPPTIEELLSTGRLQLIRNARMRLAIVSFSQAIEGIRQLNSDIQTDRAVLSRRYASLITLGLQDQDNVTCDFDAMRRSEAFRNDLADNSYRHEAYVREVVIDQQDLRVDLHALLDRELQITHSDGTTEKRSEM